MQNRDTYELMFGLGSVISGTALTAMLFAFAVVKGSDLGASLAIASCAGGYLANGSSALISESRGIWFTLAKVGFAVAVICGLASAFTILAH